MLVTGDTARQGCRWLGGQVQRGGRSEHVIRQHRSHLSPFLLCSPSRSPSTPSPSPRSERLFHCDPMCNVVVLEKFYCFLFSHQGCSE